VPFGFKEEPEFESGSPQIRENVDAGTNVIDLRAMMADLEAGREKG
jgi:hypothetical protein